MLSVLTPILRLTWLLAICCATSAAYADVSAQDKATARQAATEGIERYRAGDFAGAYELLTRAQALYEAPPHLLYIARAEHALGRWVEAAETYRALARRGPLSGDPPAFKRALDEGARELAALLPTIPRLLLKLPSPTPQALSIELDAQPLPPEVVGLERPTNPGERLLKVNASGYREFARNVHLGSGQLLEVVVELEALPPAEEVAKVPASPAGRVQPVPTSAPQRGGRGSPTVHEEPALTFLTATARLGLGLPGGQLPAAAASPVAEDALRLTRIAGAGLELDLALGFSLPIRWWVFRQIGASLFIQADGFRARQSYEPYREFSAETESGPVSQSSFGASVRLGASRDVTGGFGELGVVFSRQLAWSQTQAGACGDGAASLDIRASGTGLRLGGGISIPMSSWFRLEPYAGLNVGAVNKVNYTPNACLQSQGFGAGAADSFFREAATKSVSEGESYLVFSLGVGGEFGWGL